jgi:hypothetical protein
VTGAHADEFEIADALVVRAVTADEIGSRVRESAAQCQHAGGRAQKVGAGCTRVAGQVQSHLVGERPQHPLQARQIDTVRRDGQRPQALLGGARQPRKAEHDHLAQDRRHRRQHFLARPWCSGRRFQGGLLGFELPLALRRLVGQHRRDAVNARPRRVARTDHTAESAARHPAADDVPVREAHHQRPALLELGGEARPQGLRGFPQQRFGRPLGEHRLLDREHLLRGGWLWRAGGVSPRRGRCRSAHRHHGHQDVPADAGLWAGALRLRRRRGEIDSAAFDLDPQKVPLRADDGKFDGVEIFASAAHQALIGERAERVVVEGRDRRADLF